MEVMAKNVEVMHPKMMVKLGEELAVIIPEII